MRRRRRSRLLAAIPLAAVGFSACDGEDGSPTSPAPTGAGGARIDRVEVVSAPAAGGAYLAGEELAFGVWLTSGAPVEAAGDVFLIFDLGLAREPAALTGVDGEWLEFRYRIRPGDYDGDGVSVPAGELMFSAGGSLRVGGIALDPNLPELPPVEEHRVFARYAPGETLAFDAALDRLPVPSLGVSGAIGCTARDDFVQIVEAVLDQNLAAAAGLWSAARQTGRCAALVEGEAAIFLSAEILEHDGVIYDLVLAYGPGELRGERVAANWWTLADFLAPAP